MENLVLYRKYRPKTFAEMVGQKHIIKTLTNALTLGKVAHAYLFCGPRGTGKTTIARILAKAINCETRQKDLKFGPEPCNKCAACAELNEGRALDLIEIDAASNRGIDEIRELREGIKFAPNRLKYKVFIIDEVHMLTREAFNALLKTLEEPPRHAIFILATTEIHKVPQTIISRCQHFDFHKLTIEKIIERLKFIAKKEDLKIDDKALELIALNAEGAARDAESLLGQVMATCLLMPERSDGGQARDKDITFEEVRLILGTTDLEAVIKMGELLIKKDAREALIFINKIAQDGYDLAQFAKSLINYFRQMMILAAYKEFANDEKSQKQMRELFAPELTREQFKLLAEQSQKFSAAEIVRAIKFFIRAENDIKSAVLPQLPLEMAVVEILNQ